MLSRSRDKKSNKYTCASNNIYLPQLNTIRLPPFVDQPSVIFRAIRLQHLREPATLAVRLEAYLLQEHIKVRQGRRRRNQDTAHRGRQGTATSRSGSAAQSRTQAQG